MKNFNNYPIKNKKVLLRSDLNVPVKNGIIIDKTRIHAIKQTINYFRKNNNKIFLLSHFGRPKGKFNNNFSLKFLCSTLADCFSVNKIHFAPSLDIQIINEIKRTMHKGEICLLENIRFYIEEENNDLGFAKNLASCFDVYVNDAFSVSHRNHVSITGITKFLPSVAGLALSNEVDNLNKLLINPNKPIAAIIGGSKVSTKLSLLNNLVGLFDTIIIGGAMANTFLLAKGFNIGKSLIEKDLVKEANNILRNSNDLNCKIILPIDVICADNLSNPKNINLVKVNKIRKDQMVLDIGKNTIQIIQTHLKDFKMILWNGPLGAFETKPFDKGTNQIIQILKNLSLNQNIIIAAGGGETVVAIKETKTENCFSYISNAGGAFLEWLEGKESPGIKALKENRIP